MSKIPNKAICLPHLTDAILTSPTSRLKLEKSMSISRKAFLLVDNGEAKGIVRFGHIKKSGSGYEINYKLTEKFDASEGTNVPADWYGVFEDACLQEITKETPTEQAVEQAEVARVEKIPFSSFLALCKTASISEMDMEDYINGGAHKHHLNRKALQTHLDGEHFHVFVSQNRQAFYITGFDGAHVHTLDDSSTSMSNIAVDHEHTVILPDHETSTTLGTAHRHALNFFSSSHDGSHQHTLTLPSGEVLVSLRLEDFWTFFEMDSEMVAPMDPVQKSDQEVVTEVKDAVNSLSGLALSTPAIDIVAINGKELTLQIRDTLPDALAGSLELEVSKALEAQGYTAKYATNKFGAQHSFSAPVAKLTVEFGAQQCEFYDEIPQAKASYGERDVAFQYAFHKSGEFNTIFRIQDGEDTVVLTTTAARSQKMASIISSLTDAEDTLAQASIEGSRYQKPLKGVYNFVKVEKEIGTTMLNHNGKAFLADESVVLATVGKAKAELGLCTQGYAEYFLHSGDPKISGILVVKEDRMTIKSDLLPATLTQDAVDAGVMPPLGVSGLPQSLEAIVPTNLRYWEASTEIDARYMRDNLVKTGIINDRSVAIVDNKFSLIEKEVTYKAHTAAPEVEIHTDSKVVNEVSSLLSSDGRDTVLFDTSLASKMTLDQIISEASDLKDEDYLIAYPASKVAEKKLQTLGKVFKLKGYANTAFVTSAQIQHHEDTLHWVDDVESPWTVAKAPTAPVTEETISNIRDVKLINKFSAGPSGDQQFVYGVVLEPETFDAHNHIYDEEAIREACHSFMEKSASIKIMHEGSFVMDKVRILECFIAPDNFEIEGVAVKKGSWLLALRILDRGLWQQVKDGVFNAFSIGALATHIPLA